MWYVQGYTEQSPASVTLTGHLHQSCWSFIFGGKNLQSRLRTSLLGYEVQRTKKFLFLPLPAPAPKGLQLKCLKQPQENMNQFEWGTVQWKPRTASCCVLLLYISISTPFWGGCECIWVCVSVQHGGREQSCCSCLLCQLHGSFHCGKGRNWQQPEWSWKVGTINKSPTDKCSPEMLPPLLFFFF